LHFAGALPPRCYAQLLTRRPNRLCSVLPQSARTRHSSPARPKAFAAAKALASLMGWAPLTGPALVVPLARAVTPCWRFVVAPNLMKYIMKGRRVPAHDCVIGACFRMTKAALRCLAVDRHTTAEHDLFGRRVNSTRGPSFPNLWCFGCQTQSVRCRSRGPLRQWHCRVAMFGRDNR